MPGRNPYTTKEDSHLVEYLAEQCPGPSGRLGKILYQTLVEDPETYPWGKGHSWQSWRERYKTYKPYFDDKIVKYQAVNDVVADVEGRRSSQRAAFTDDEDKYLTKYLAVYCPRKEGRSGNEVYKQLRENADKKWSWSARHPWQGWRSHYIDNAEKFDRRILAYQQRHNIAVNASPRKRAANGSHSERAVKRPKVKNDYDSQEAQWSRINWSSLSTNVSKIAGPSKDREVKVEVKKETRIGPVASTSKEQIAHGDEHKNEDDRDDGSDDDDDADAEESDDDPRPVGSEDYGGEIFQNGTMGESQGEMPGIEEEVVGEEISDDDSPPELNDRPNASPEKILDKADAPLHLRDEHEDHLLVDDVRSSSLSPPKPAQPKRHGNLSINNFTMISRSKHIMNDDPFEDLPSSPHNKLNPPLRKTKPLPVIIEGAFGNRSQKRTKKVSMESSMEESSDDQETAAHWDLSPRPPRTKESDDKVEAKATWPPLRGKRSSSEGVVGIQSEVDLEHQAAEQRRREKSKQRAEEPDESVVIKPRMEVPVNGPHQSAPLPPKPSRLPIPNAQDIPEAGPNRVTKAQRRATDVSAPPAPLPETMAVKSPKRHSTGNIGSTSKPSNSRPINLRQELAHRQLLQQKQQQQPQQLPLMTRRSSSQSSHVSSSIVTEDDNQILQLQQVGFEVVKMFSEEFGFTEDVVLRAWNKVKSLIQLKEVLAKMKESADRMMDELMEDASNVSSTISRRGQNTSQSFGTSLEFDKRVNLDLDGNLQSSPFFVVHPDRDEFSPTEERRNSSIGGGGSKGRKSLEIRLVDPERASADVASLYQPLTGTRAGNFNRLAKMGREEEALEREQRRVSSVALSPLRNIPQEQQPRVQGMHEDEILGVDDDDVLEEIEIPILGEDSGEGSGMDVLPDSEEEDDEMGEDSHEVEDRLINVEPDSIQPQLNGEERQYYDVENEQRELNDAQPKINGRGNVEQEMKIEPDVDGMVPRSAEKVEAIVVVPTDAERWEEVENLFRAANWGNVDMLKKVEKGFSTRFLKEWLANKFMI